MIKLKPILVALILILISCGLGIIFVNFGTVIHEVLGHGTVAKIFGCDFESTAEVFTGTTEFECPTEIPAVNILISFGSIFVVFFSALALWLFLDKNSIIRVIALFMFVYSLIPSAFPLMKGSDMYYAINQGFPEYLAWLIFIIMFGVFMWLLIDEITDKDFFKSLVKRR